MRQKSIHYIFLLVCSAVAWGEETRSVAPQIYGQEPKYECTTVKNPKGEGVRPPFTFRLCVHVDFKDSARGVLRQGFQEFIERIQHAEVRQCVRGRHATYEDVKRAVLMEKLLVKFKDTQGWLDGLAPSVTVATDLKSGRVYLSPLDEKSDAAAVGYLNYFQAPLNETPSTYPHFSISVPVDLGQASGAPHSGDNSFWAAALGNALFSNLGMEDSPLRLSFSNSYLLERCLLWDGKIPQAYLDENVGGK